MPVVTFQLFITLIYCSKTLITMNYLSLFFYGFDSVNLLLKTIFWLPLDIVYDENYANYVGLSTSNIKKIKVY